MKTKIGFAALGIGAILLAAFGNPRLHAPAAAGALLLAWLVDRKLARASGKPWRWLVALLVLGFLGGLLGPKDARWLGRDVSLEGALAAGTMVLRGIGIVLATAGLLALVPRERLLAKLGTTPLAGFAEVVTVAIGLVPVLSRELATRTAALRRDPASRSWLGVHSLAVATVVLASETAEKAARDLADRQKPT